MVGKIQFWTLRNSQSRWLLERNSEIPSGPRPLGVAGVDIFILHSYQL